MFLPHFIPDTEKFMRKFRFVRIKRFFRWPWQILTRGFCDKDLWSLDYTIAKFIRPRIRAFRDNLHSHPGDLTEQQWDDILKSIEDAMDLICKEEEETRILTSFEAGQVEIGLNNLAYYFRDLWD
jgi:hypothetical protein